MAETYVEAAFNGSDGSQESHFFRATISSPTVGSMIALATGASGDRLGYPCHLYAPPTADTTPSPPVWMERSWAGRDSRHLRMRSKAPVMPVCGLRHEA